MNSANFDESVDERSTRRSLASEIGLAGLVLAGLAGVTWRFFRSGQLGHPFQTNPADSFMDLFNTAYWAHAPGAYHVWHTVYPPLSFVLLRSWTRAVCYRGDAYFARACDPGAVWPIIACYAVNVVLVFISLRRRQPRTALLRTIGFCGGLPMLYGLELANLIIPSFTVFVLGWGGLVQRPWMVALCQAVSINFKPYLLIALMPPLIRRHWRAVAAVLVSGLGVYGLSLALNHGQGTPIDLLNDLMTYARGQGPIYADRNHLAENAAATRGAWNLLLAPFLRLGEAVVAGCLVLAALRPEKVIGNRLLALTLTLTSSEAALHTLGYSADYSQIFWLMLVFLEPWNGRLSGTMITCAYLLCVPTDFELSHIASLQTSSWLSGHTVLASYGVQLNQFVRPVLLVIIQASLAGLIVSDLASTAPCEAPRGHFGV